MKTKLTGALSFCMAVFLALSASAKDPAPIAATVNATSLPTYNLSPNDMVELKVFQEDDMTTQFRIAKDGTANLPLIGVVRIGGKSVDQATKHITALLNKDYLVNPQVTLTVIEYAKRRFTVLGQVQKPGSFEIPNEEEVTLLQAVAMAGGYTRLANTTKITVARTRQGKRTTTVVDGKAMAKDPKAKPFLIYPDDTISVAERVF